MIKAKTTRALKRQQINQFLPRKWLERRVVRFDYRIHEGGLGGDHRVYLFFECAAGDELEDLDAACLSDTVDAICGLVFSCGIPLLQILI